MNKMFILFIDDVGFIRNLSMIHRVLIGQFSSLWIALLREHT